MLTDYRWGLYFTCKGATPISPSKIIWENPPSPRPIWRGLKSQEQPMKHMLKRAVNGSVRNKGLTWTWSSTWPYYTSKFRLQGQSLVQHFKNPNESKYYPWGPPRWIPIFMGGIGGGMVALIMDAGDIANPWFKGLEFFILLQSKGGWWMCLVREWSEFKRKSVE